jgi:hypothetical protein
MSKISHFVVTYNHDTKEWDIDGDAVQRLGGNIYDSVSNEWHDPEEDSDEMAVDMMATSILFNTLITLGSNE